MVSSLLPRDHAWAASVDLPTFLRVDSFSVASCLPISCHKEIFCLQDSELNSMSLKHSLGNNQASVSQCLAVRPHPETIKKAKTQTDKSKSKSTFVTLPRSNQILYLMYNFPSPPPTRTLHHISNWPKFSAGFLEKPPKDTIGLENYQTRSQGLEHLIKDVQHQCV